MSNHYIPKRDINRLPKKPYPLDSEDKVAINSKNQDFHTVLGDIADFVNSTSSSSHSGTFTATAGVSTITMGTSFTDASSYVVQITLTNAGLNGAVLYSLTNISGNSFEIDLSADAEGNYTAFSI